MSISKPRLRISELPVLLFSLVIFSNVLSNLQIFDKNVVLYMVKHGAVLLAAVFGITTARYMRPSVLTFFVLLAILYFYAGLYFYALMIIPFGLATNYFGFHFRQIYRSRFLSLYYKFIAFTFLTLSVPIYVEQGFFNTTYGRPRLTTPFGHPKEAAMIITIPLLLFVSSFRRKVSTYSFLILISYLVSSRNILLFWSIKIMTNSLFKLSVVMAVIVVTVLFAIFFVDIRFLDQYTSLRAGIWLRALQNASQTSEVIRGISSNQRFGFDSFWIESLVAFKTIPTILLLGLFLNLLLTRKSVLALSIGLSFLVTTFFDTGIASTGNLLHLMFFTYIQTKKVSRL